MRSGEDDEAKNFTSVLERKMRLSQQISAPQSFGRFCRSRARGDAAAVSEFLPCATAPVERPSGFCGGRPALGYRYLTERGDVHAVERHDARDGREQPGDGAQPAQQ